MPRIIITRLIFIALLAGALPATSHALEPTTAPMLRMETGMHTAMIWRIDVDRPGRWLMSFIKGHEIWDKMGEYRKGHLFGKV